MRITCIGGGPAGLYFALLMKLQDPRHEVTLIERNAPSDTFGWGVVFSDQTLGALQRTDAKTAGQILDAFNHWDDIDVHFQGRTIRSSGHGFCGIGRKRLLNILQDRCAELGVVMRYSTDCADDADIDADLIIACDGLNSRIRTRYAATYQPDIDLRRCRFVWLGTGSCSTPSPSPSRRPSGAGSRPMPTASTRPRRPSSSRRRRRSGAPPGWRAWTRKKASASARSCSRSTSTAMR
jgi:2-polyprenyl-6-methoxyphenol hydroxylase-like FAD-dependent oxidoreductase